MKQKFAFINKKMAAAGVAVSGVVLSASSNAQSVLPADFSLADTQADITTAGGAIIALAIVAMGVRWVKATFF